MTAPGANAGETAPKKGRKTRKQVTQLTGIGPSQRPHGGGDNSLELLDAVARFSLNSQQQTRKLCATVWDFALLPGTAPNMLAGRTAARHYTSLNEIDAKPHQRVPPNPRVAMGMLESLSSQQGALVQPRKTVASSWHGARAPGGAAQCSGCLDTTLADQGDRQARQRERHGDAGGGNARQQQTDTGHEGLNALHPLHECLLSTIAAKQQQQGLAHPVGTGEVRANERCSSRETRRECR